jgi:hypothetical protein
MYHDRTEAVVWQHREELSPEWMPAGSMCSMMPMMCKSVAVADGVYFGFFGAFEELVNEHALSGMCLKM